MRIVFFMLLAVAACDDPAESGVSEVPRADGWCGVQAVFADRCERCHAGAEPFGSLDLRIDPHNTVVDAPSNLYSGAVLVVPGDPHASLLYLKISDSQSARQGGRMPPGRDLPERDIEVVREWIEAGADDVCAVR